MSFHCYSITSQQTANSWQLYACGAMNEVRTQLECRFEHVMIAMDGGCAAWDLCIYLNIHGHTNDKDFMNSDIRHKKNACDRYWKQYQQTNSDEFHDRFKEMRRKVVYVIRQSKYNIEN